MPTVQILLSDHRLPVGRKLTALVRVARPAMEGSVKHCTHEIVALVDRVGQTPLEFELDSGTWSVSVKSAYFPEIVRDITISNSLSKQIILLTVDLIPAPYQTKPHEVREGQSYQYESYARHLTPSRADASISSRIGKIVSAEKKPQNIFAVYDFEFHPLKTSQACLFSEADSFDERMTYWMGGWCNRNISEPVQVRAGRRLEGANEATCVVDVKLDLSKFVRKNKRTKTMLGIKFRDQTFSVVLPPVQASRLTGDVAPIHLEVSFLDEKLDCSSYSHRLLGVRMHTNNPNFDAVTQFLADGQMPSALKVWGSLSEKVLHSKDQDPIGSSAAGIILVHAYLSRIICTKDVQTWEKWMHSLSIDFDSIADGAIGEAWMKALHPAARDIQIKNAKAGFESAVRRGLPIFTEAVRLLSRGAEWAYQEEETSVDSLMAIRWLTNRVLPGNALTTIRHEDN